MILNNLPVLNTNNNVGQGNQLKAYPGFLFLNMAEKNTIDWTVCACDN